MLAIQVTTEGKLKEVQLNTDGEGNLEILQSAVGGWVQAVEDRKSTRLNSSHSQQSRMPSSA